MKVKQTGNFITVEPIKPKPKMTGEGYDYPAWFAHRLDKNRTLSFLELRSKIQSGQIERFTCWDEDCDCGYKKI